MQKAVDRARASALEAEAALCEEEANAAEAKAALEESMDAVADWQARVGTPRTSAQSVADWRAGVRLSHLVASNTITASRLVRSKISYAAACRKCATSLREYAAAVRECISDDDETSDADTDGDESDHDEVMEAYSEIATDESTASLQASEADNDAVGSNYDEVMEDKPDVTTEESSVSFSTRWAAWKAGIDARKTADEVERGAGILYEEADHARLRAAVVVAAAEARLPLHSQGEKDGDVARKELAEAVARLRAAHTRALGSSPGADDDKTKASHDDHNDDECSQSPSKKHKSKASNVSAFFI